MKPADVNLKFVTIYEYQYRKIFLQKVTFQIGRKKFLELI